MLVLTRRPGESVYIGDVRVIVVMVERNVVRFGFEADRSIPIHREEVWERIQAEGKVNAPVEFVIDIQTDD